MNSGITAVIAVLAVMAARRRTGGRPVSTARFLAVFALVLLLHVTVIGGLVALHLGQHF
jgi:crotonobetainyl-CoA:carnitine CoA-transferase CaiB-like acyl-CoA transferase